MGDEGPLADVVVVEDVDLRRDAVVLPRTVEPLVVVGRLEPKLHVAVTSGDRPSPRPGRVVELQWLPRLTRIGVPVAVAGPFERRDADVVHPEVVGVGVALLVVPVGHDDLRTRSPDDGNESAHGLIEVGPVEGARIVVAGALRHARVAVAEHDDLVETDDRGGVG